MATDDPRKRPRGRPKRAMPDEFGAVPPGAEQREMQNMDQYLFYIKTAQASSIKNFIEAIKDDVERIPFEIGFDGIHIGISIGHESRNSLPCVSANLHKNNFDVDYVVKRPVTFHIDSHNLCKLLKIVNTNMKITFMMEDHEPGRIDNFQELRETLTICLETANGPSTIYYEVPVTIDVQDQNIAGVNINVEGRMVSMPSNTLLNHCKHFGSLDQNNLITISRYRNITTLGCPGCEFAMVKAEIRSATGTDTVVGAEIPEDEIIEGTFRIGHITGFSKCSNLSKYVTLYLSNQSPLVIEYNVGTLGTLRISIPPVVDLDAE